VTTSVHYDRDRVHTGVVSATGAYTATNEDTLIIGATAGGAFTVTLPLAASVRPGHVIEFKKSDASANDMTVSRAGSDTIDGANTKVLGAQYDYLRLVSNGATVWHVMAAELNT
jgi:hypothetical protein